MFDTDIVSDLVRNPSGRVAQRIEEVGDDGLCVSIVVAAELRFGCAKRGSASLLRRVEAVLSALEIAPLDVPCDAHFADIRNALEQSGRLIGPNDLLIAAHACAFKLPLVTHNAAEFARVDGLTRTGSSSSLGRDATQSGFKRRQRRARAHALSTILAAADSHSRIGESRMKPTSGPDGADVSANITKRIEELADLPKRPAARSG